MDQIPRDAQDRLILPSITFWLRVTLGSSKANYLVVKRRLQEMTGIFVLVGLAIHKDFSIPYHQLSHRGIIAFLTEVVDCLKNGRALPDTISLKEFEYYPNKLTA